MITKLLISISVGLLVTYIASQLLVTATKNSFRYQTQTSLNVYHANALASLNNVRNLRIALGLTTAQESGTNLAQWSAANTQNASTMQTCLGSVGTNCQAFDNQTVDLSALAQSGNATKNGSSSCAKGASCPFTQTIFAKWNCDQPQRCSQLNITVTTKDANNTTKYNVLTSTLTIAARSLLGRSQINFACASQPSSFFIQNLNYDSGVGKCEPVPHVNNIGSVQNIVPARAIAADSSSQVQHAPKRQRCDNGFSEYHVYAGTSSCLEIDPNLVAAASQPTAQPTVAEPTPAPSPSDCTPYIVGPNGEHYDISNATSYSFVGRCGANYCVGYGAVDPCPQPVVVSDPDTSCGNRMMCNAPNNGGGMSGGNGGAGGGNSGSGGSSGGGGGGD